MLRRFGAFEMKAFKKATSTSTKHDACAFRPYRHIEVTLVSDLEFDPVSKMPATSYIRSLPPGFLSDFQSYFLFNMISRDGMSLGGSWPRYYFISVAVSVRS